MWRNKGDTMVFRGEICFGEDIAGEGVLLEVGMLKF